MTTPFYRFQPPYEEDEGLSYSEYVDFSACQSPLHQESCADASFYDARGYYSQMPAPAWTTTSNWSTDLSQAQSSLYSSSHYDYPVAAHQPISPEQRSSYSELAVNLEFMRKLQEQDRRAAARAAQEQQLQLQLETPVVPSHTHTQAPIPPASQKAGKSVTRDEDTTFASPSSPTLTSRKFVAAPTTYVAVPPPASPSDSPSTPPASSPSLLGPIRNVKEPRRPSLACTFCRERKIACGRPPEGSPDQTCNQCARRNFKCEYIKEQRSQGKNHRRK